MDFLNLGGKLRGVFSPINPIGGGNNQPRRMWDEKMRPSPDNQDDDSQVLSTLERLYSPQHDYTDLYRKGLDEMPQRQEPGKLRKLFGALAGLGQNGPENQERVNYGPYMRKMGDWSERMKALQPGMTSERYENTNERMLAHQAVSDILRERDISRRERTDAANIEIRQQRAKAYEDNLTFKNSHPEHELKGIPGGNYVWFNPRDANEEPIDTGIKSGTLSKLEEMTLAQKNALARIRETGDQARQTEGVREGNRETLEDKRIAGRKDVKAAPSDTGSETITETEITERDDQGNPAKARRTVVKKPLGKVAPGFVRMKSPDGKSTKDVPISQKDHYLKLGAKEVKE